MKMQPVDPRALTADQEFDRRWAMTVLDQAISALEETYARNGQSELLAALKPFLTGESQTAYSDLARQLNKNEGALRISVHRLRQQFRDTVKSVISQTVEHPEQVETELADLKAALRDKVR
jgi:RNA polymerase sigma-70 factor (ECF subfamily)